MRKNIPDDMNFVDYLVFSITGTIHQTNSLIKTAMSSFKAQTFREDFANKIFFDNQTHFILSSYVHK